VVDQFESRINGTFAGHIAIVDDVLTTGATIEAVVKSIRSKNEHIRISIITLAITT
jgi:predicted amidophosphoribosyltransferase